MHILMTWWVWQSSLFASNWFDSICVVLERNQSFGTDNCFRVQFCYGCGCVGSSIFRQVSTLTLKLIAYFYDVWMQFSRDGGWMSVYVLQWHGWHWLLSLLLLFIINVLFNQCCIQGASFDFQQSSTCRRPLEAAQVRITFCFIS